MRTRSSFAITLFVLTGLLGLWSGAADAEPKKPDTVLFGVAYYDEYTPVDRVEEDARMMKAAGISVVRIAESTWGTLEPQEGVDPDVHVYAKEAPEKRQAQRSTSQRTISSEPRMVTASAT